MSDEPRPSAHAPRSGLTAVVLAGGLGSRLAPVVSDVPKPLTPVAGRPFMEFVDEWLSNEGVVHTIFAAGHLGDQIEVWMNGLRRSHGRVTCRRESVPMGTGGAVLACLDICEDVVLVSNGDTLLLTELDPLINRLRTGVDAVIVAVPVRDASRFGMLDVGRDGFLRSLREREPGAGVVNGGLYVFPRRVLERFLPARPLSLEREIVRSLLLQGARIAVEVSDAPFIDIGTPASLATAEAFVDAHVRNRDHWSPFSMDGT